LKKTAKQEKEIIYTFKIVIIGGPSVGKTCLFNRFCFNSFNFDTSMTIGLNFHSMNLKITHKNGIENFSERYVVNSIFDFGGQERFKPLIPKFLGGANGALLVFDLTTALSFDNLDFWYNQLLEYGDGLTIPKILVGSKSDLLDKTQREEINRDNIIKDYAKKHTIDGYFKTSALKNYNVLEVFKELNNLMLKRYNTPYVIS